MFENSSSKLDMSFHYHVINRYRVSQMQKVANYMLLYRLRKQDEANHSGNDIERHA